MIIMTTTIIIEIIIKIIKIIMIKTRRKIKIIYEKEKKDSV